MSSLNHVCYCHERDVIGISDLPRMPIKDCLPSFVKKNNHGISDGMSAASLIMDETLMVYQYCRYITDNGYQVGIYNHQGLLFKL